MSPGHPDSHQGTATRDSWPYLHFGNFSARRLGPTKSTRSKGMRGTPHGTIQVRAAQSAMAIIDGGAESHP